MPKQTNNEDVSGWTGWISFAAIMLGLSGIFHMIAGFVGLFRDDLYGVTANGIWLFDYSTWGWIHILGGALLFAASSSLFQGKMYGRIMAILAAMGSLAVNVAFIPVYPIWSIIMVVIGIMVIWAVTVHGKEMQVQQ